MKRKSVIKQFLFKHLEFETYLFILSKLYFISYRIGLLKFSKAYTYHYALKKFIKSGDIVIDIGANLGYYTVLFSRWVKSNGKVFAVEPVQPVFNTLKKNTAGLSNITLLNFALGDENKSIRMANESKEKYGYITSGTHFVYSDSHTDINESSFVFFNAEMKKGSELFNDLPKIDFIKCDVEGFELVILNDIKSLIQKCKPSMLIETSEESRQKVLEFMYALEYQSYVIVNNKLESYAEGKLPTPDILFLPAGNK